MAVVFDQFDGDIDLDFFISTLAAFNNAVITSAVLQRLLRDGYFPAYGMTKYREEVEGDILESVRLRRVSYNSPLEIAIATEQFIGYGLRALAHIRDIWRLLTEVRNRNSLSPSREVQNAIKDQQLEMISQVAGWQNMSNTDRTLLENSIRQQVTVLAQIKSLSLTNSTELPPPR